MKSIKIILVFTVFIVLLGQCTSKPKNLSIHITVIDKVNPSRFIEQTGLFDSIKIEIKNNTDTIFGFWTMSCSWMENWITEDSVFVFSGINCRSNCPIFEQILPKQKITYNSIIQLLDTTSVYSKNIKNFRLGLVWIKKHEVLALKRFKFFDVLDTKRKAKKDIIWSNTVEFKR